MSIDTTSQMGDTLNGEDIVYSNTMVKCGYSANTDGILVKLFKPQDESMIKEICNEWSNRTKMELEFDKYHRVYQKDVNNYIIINDDNGKHKSIGSFAKEPSEFDNHLPIVRTALIEYFLHNTPIEETIGNCNDLHQFQFITKITNKYLHFKHGYDIIDGKVQRCFASKDTSHPMLFKRHYNKISYDKTAGTPDKCFIDNGNVVGKQIPKYLDKNWYIDLTKSRIKEFIG